MRRIISATLSLWLGLAGSSFAQSQPGVVVELYTSQGCSSCPPADKYLAEIADRDDVIALSLHVDYWDYIGWKDTFGSPANTRRQNGYARAAGSATVYTPQFVIGGVDHVVGSKPIKIAALIEAHAGNPAPVALVLTRNGETVHIEATAVSAANGGMLVQLVRYLPEATVDIERGENAGRSITYHNVVTGIDALGEWDGQGTYAADAPLGAGAPAVVILQAPGHGEILAAARLR